LWGNRAVFVNQQTTGIDFAAAPSVLNEWFYSASYVGPSIVKFAFKAAVTAIGTTAAATSMNQDSIKALYSVDCGASWQIIKAFASSDLGNGNVSNSLKEFSFDLFNNRGSILVGFAAYRKSGAPATAGFTFHVDSISITTPSFPDFSALGLLPGLDGILTCPGPQPVTLGVVVRNSGSQPITSATVGYRLNGVVTSRLVNFSGTGLASGKLDTIRFTGAQAPVYASPGNYFLKGFINLPSESPSTAFNDSSSSSIFTLFGKVPVPYNETFQLPGLLPIGWAADTISGRGFKHTLGRGPAGTQALSFRAQPTSTRAVLVTRNFGEITSATNFLSFAYRSQDNTNALFRLRPSDYIDVLVSGNCGVSYTSVGRIDSINQQIAAGFLGKDFPINAFIGQDITVKLDVKLTPKFAQTVFFDVSRFTIGGPTGAADLIESNSPNFFVYPNPASKFSGLNIKAKETFATADAYSLNGQKISMPISNQNEGVLSLSTANLSPGMYVLILHGDKGPVKLRFVIEK
jgi:hypothetical protein